VRFLFRSAVYTGLMEKLTCLLGTSLASFAKAQLVAQRILQVNLDDGVIRRTCLRKGHQLLHQQTGITEVAAGALVVGSAQRNLQARLERHGRRRKPLRWQIDYLSTRAPLVGALVLRGPKSWECRVAALLAKHYPRPIARFGASDCRCGGHLFFCPA
jgi:Uri superfamily endonuclease